MATETSHPTDPKPDRSDPARHAIAVTPDDSNDLTIQSRGVYIGGGGNLKVTMAGNQDVTFIAVPAGTLLPIAVNRIWATGTGATSIVSVW